MGEKSPSLVKKRRKAAVTRPLKEEPKNIVAMPEPSPGPILLLIGDQRLKVSVLVEKDGLGKPAEVIKIDR